MTLDGVIMFVGVCIALLPFLGFPLIWDNVILVFLGILVIALGIAVRRRGLLHKSAVQRGGPAGDSHEA